MVLDILENPTAAKMEGTSAHRRALTPKTEHGLVSIMAPEGEFYANAVGTFGVSPASRNWDRLASAVRRWSLKPVGEKETVNV